MPQLSGPGPQAGTLLPHKKTTPAPATPVTLSQGAQVTSTTDITFQDRTQTGTPTIAHTAPSGTLQNCKKAPHKQCQYVHTRCSLEGPMAAARRRRQEHSNLYRVSFLGTKRKAAAPDRRSVTGAQKGLHYLTGGRAKTVRDSKKQICSSGV